MDLPRLLAPAAATALLTAAAVALAPAASAHSRHSRHSRHSTGSGGGPLPAASSVVPKLVGPVTVTAAPGASVPTTASAAWTVPACSGTVYATFLLTQRGADGGRSVYLQDKGTRAYPCQATAQTVTVRYGAADPSQGALTADDVVLTTTTYTAASGGEQTSSTSTTARAVVSATGLPPATDVVPRLLQGVSLHADPSSPTGVTAAARWVVPACTGTVRAAFTLFQDGESRPRAVQAQGPTAYPCSPADQVVTVVYRPSTAGAPAMHAGPADAWVDTCATGSGGNGHPLQSARTAATLR